MKEEYDKMLLKEFLPSLVMWNFAGRPILKKHNKIVTFFRWLLRKEPDYEDLPFPKSVGDKIKFRRYSSK